RRSRLHGRGRYTPRAAVSCSAAPTAGKPGSESMRSALLASAMVFAGVAVTAHAAKEALPPLDPALAAQGRSIYAPHGPQGHTWKHSDAMLYRIVREGWRDPFNKTKRLTMPAFRDVLSPRETR